MRHDRILLGHGGGGRLTRELLEDIFLPLLGNPVLNRLDDAALVTLPSARLAFTTDTHVVSPVFFPGGDIGRLAVCGTVNDLAVSGARPRYLSCSFVLEEGLPLDDLRRVVTSMAEAAAETDVQVVAGDTKVVERGRADALYITTAGIGEMHQLPDGWGEIVPGDHVLVSGDLGNHGFAVLCARAGLGFSSDIVSDCAPLHALIAGLLTAGVHLRWMRDPTRGGLAAALNELAAGHSWGVVLDGEAIPVSGAVRALQELLGIDPLESPCEGRLVAVVAPEHAEWALEMMRSHPLGRAARLIGRIEPHLDGLVAIRTLMGGHRILDMPLGEQLPRIC